WREARLCLARPSNSAQTLYGSTLGTAEAASWLWRDVALKAGLSNKTYVHGLGDGAPWIVDKFRDNFGSQGSYLLDFYHVSRYLSERHDCLDYAAARAAELPIGSGEVESGHRHVIQRRLKVAGAWWNQINAQAMLNLRTARANRHWSQHWSVQN